jgi:hypothetical protein
MTFLDRFCRNYWMTFLGRFWRNPPITNFKKSRPVGAAELCHADGQTARLKPTRHIFYKHFIRQSLTPSPVWQQARFFIQDLKLSQRCCWPILGGCEDAVSADNTYLQMFRKNRIVVIFRLAQSTLLAMLDPEDEGILILLQDGNTL